MSFRDPEHRRALAVDPLARFLALDDALERGRGLLGDRNSLRLAAVHLVATPGEPDELAGQVRAIHAELERAGGFELMFSSPLWLVAAAILVASGDAAGPFAAELTRVRALMRAHKIRRHAAYELIATIALRVHNQLAPISDEQIARVKAVYKAMKRHHWWLTGPEDLPACAVLATSGRDPDELAARANAVYEGIRAHARVWPGEALQTASNTLARSSLEPAELVQRYVTLTQTFADAGGSIGLGEYDDLALLSFLAQPAALIVETVQAYRAAIRERLAWTEGDSAFGLASNLAFVRLLGHDPELGPLVDAKALFDMQRILEAQAAG